MHSLSYSLETELEVYGDYKKENTKAAIKLHQLNSVGLLFKLNYFRNLSYSRTGSVSYNTSIQNCTIGNIL